MPTMTLYTTSQLLDYVADTLALYQPGTGLRAALELAAVPQDAHQAVLEIAHETLDHAKDGQR